MSHNKFKDSYNDGTAKSRKSGRNSGKSAAVLAAFLAAVILAAGGFMAVKLKSGAPPSASDSASAQPVSTAAFSSMELSAVVLSDAEPTPAEPMPAEPTPAEPTPAELPLEPAASSEAPKVPEETEKAEANEAAVTDDDEYSAFQKLENGIGINILVMGDESAADSDGDAVNGIVDGAKLKGLSDYLEGKYLSNSGAKVTITNLAWPGGNILADALRVITMPEDQSYDLIILNYGLHDQLEEDPNYYGAVQHNTELWLNYASLTAKLSAKFPDAYIICSLEPCFHEITEELDGMKRISEAYCAIPVVDWCSALLDKGEDVYYDYFEADKTLPNAKGIEVWIELLCNLIDEKVDASEGKMNPIYCGYYKAEQITGMSFIPVTDSCVTRNNDTSYTINFNADGMAFIQHPNLLVTSDAKAIADHMLYSLRNRPNGVALPGGNHVTLLHDCLECEESFELIFSSKELADGLEGFYLVGSK